MDIETANSILIEKSSIPSYALRNWIEQLTRKEYVMYGPDMHKEAAEDFMRAMQKVAAEIQGYLK